MITVSRIRCRRSILTKLACCLCLALFASSVTAEETSPQISDEAKLEIILAGKQDIPRADRLRDFAREGEINAVGRLVTIGKVVYFKTADQSFIPQGKRFPYPELLLELHLSETHAYKPLTEQNVLRQKHVLYDGPIRIQGNWAYEAPYHIFGLVWVDEVSKVSDSPEVDWGPWLEQRNSRLQTQQAPDQ